MEYRSNRILKTCFCTTANRIKSNKIKENFELWQRCCKIKKGMRSKEGCLRGQCTKGSMQTSMEGGDYDERNEDSDGSSDSQVCGRSR